MKSYEELDEVTRVILSDMISYNHGLPEGTRVLLCDYDKNFYKKPKNASKYELERWEFLKHKQAVTKQFFGKHGVVKKTHQCLYEEYLTRVLLDGDVDPICVQSYFLEVE